MTDEVSAAVERMHKAWRTADIETYLTAFDDDAELINRSGKWYRGKAAIADVLRELARTGRPALFAAERRVEAIRAVTPTVSVVHELWVEPDRTAQASYVFVRRDEDWRVTLATVVLRS